MKKRSKILGAATAGLLAILALATPASASTYTVSPSDYHAGDLCVTPFCAGSASFVKDGDHLLVWDNDYDGHSVVVKYIRSDDGGAVHKDWNHYGSLTKLDINMNLPESGWVEYEVCLGEYGTESVDLASCSEWKLEYAS
ncbi:hypothetical protein OG937_45070 [Streptomyces sp. NBC_00510]